MWICFNDAFISAVQHTERPDCLMVRARDKSHLENVFPDIADEIYSVPGSDYGYRIVVTKAEFGVYVTERIEDIDYPNFKDSVRDNKLHGFYSRIWHLGLSIIGGPSVYNNIPFTKD